MLIHRINTDWIMQRFCGIALKPTEFIKDINLLSHWRSCLGRHMDINVFQNINVQHWKPIMNDTNIGSSNATCYESYVSFPTPIKIVWKSCNAVFTSPQQCRKQLKVTYIITNRMEKAKKK